MKTLSRVTALLVVVGALGGGSRSDARDVGLRLDVSGFVAPAPEWKNSSDKTIESLNFEFAGIGDPTNPFQNVDSRHAQAKLVNAFSYPWTVSLVRPQNCSIGNGSIGNKDVAFGHNQRIYTGDQDLTIPNNSLQDFFVRFVATGGYHRYTGVVKCQDSGILTYRY